MTAIRKATFQGTKFQYITNLTTDYSTSNDRFGLKCRIYRRRMQTIKRKLLVFSGLEKHEKTGLFTPKVGAVGK